MLKGLKKQILDNVNYYEGFPKEGVTFIDIMPILQHPLLRYYLTYLLEQAIPKDVDIIVAPESRGWILSMLLSSKTYTIIPLRKQGKLPGKCYQATYKTEYSSDTLECQVQDLQGKKVLFIDDIYATGGAYKSAKELTTAMNGNLLGGVVLFDIFNEAPKELQVILKEDN